MQTLFIISIVFIVPVVSHVAAKKLSSENIAKVANLFNKRHG